MNALAFMLMSGVLAGASPSAPSRTSTAAPVLRVLILPAVSGELVSREPRLEEQTLRAFSESFTEAAASTFAWRRWHVIAGAEAEDAIRRAGVEGVCRTHLCARAVAASSGATHSLFSRLTRTRDGNCAVMLSLYDLLQNHEAQLIKESIAPCSADHVLGSALDLGRRVAEGPRAPVTITLALTPLSIRPIDIPDIPDVGPYVTTTSTRARRGLTREKALEIYKAKHMFVFEDEAPTRTGDHQRFYIARDSRLISECDARRAASAPLAADVLEFCEGNNWEWAWAGFPAGLLIAGVGAGDLQDGGSFSFVFGSTLAIVSALVAIFLNKDAEPASTGLHYSSREVVERIVARSNRTFREVLDLTEAEVIVAGMRK